MRTISFSSLEFIIHSVRVGSIFGGAVHAFFFSDFLSGNWIGSSDFSNYFCKLLSAISNHLTTILISYCEWLLVCVLYAMKYAILLG